MGWASDLPAPCGIAGLKGRHVRPSTTSHHDARGLRVTRWAALLESMGIHQVSAREIRAEAFFLGNRHQGQVVEGARLELEAPDLDPHRAVLLRAVIRATPASLAHGADATGNDL
jgi:hypothetical protein